MQEWYLGWEGVSCLERYPQIKSVLIERERGSTVVFFSYKSDTRRNSLNIFLFFESLRFCVGRGEAAGEEEGGGGGADW